ncbi:MAG: hypothetical protein P8R54_21845 [Myxococcota bacterium]|nr:hypothetical protein [Myxococcota bacterium]
MEIGCAVFRVIFRRHQGTTGSKNSRAAVASIPDDVNLVAVEIHQTADTT